MMGNSILHRMLLLLVSVLAVSCIAETSVPSNKIDVEALRKLTHRLQEGRWLEDLPTTDDLENVAPEVDGPPRQGGPDITTVDFNGDGFVYNQCSLCQGLELQAENIAFPEKWGLNATCGDMSFLIENKLLDDINYEYCRGDYAFNLMFESCCRPSIPVYNCEQNVHAWIKEQDYNSAVPPIVGYDPEDNLEVSVEFTYQALENLAVEEGTATIFITLTMVWKDPRLAWEVEDGGTCANFVTTWTGHEEQTTAIWVPDFNLLNQIEGIQTMPMFQAHVYADGTVQWSVSGGLTAFCAYQGLANIPFDTLGCQMLFGSSTREHTEAIKYVLKDPEYLLYGGFETTYNEWRAIPELAEQGYAFEGRFIYYNLFFQRATKHYNQNIVTPTIILTFLSFFTFFLDLRVGERLGFGMALALVVVAQQIVTSGMTPVSDQRLWLDKFVAWSFYWVLAGVIESVLIGYLYYIREDRESKETEASAEELEPLTIVDDQPSNERESKNSNENTSTTKDCFLIACCKKITFEWSLRTLDMIAFGISVTTYTAFIIVMYSTAATDVWLVNEPEWFDEESNIFEMGGAYVNGDPNN